MILTRSPLSPEPKLRFSLDLHVLSAPPAFVLSQDQTLRERVISAHAETFTSSLRSKFASADRFDRGDETGFASPGPELPKQHEPDEVSTFRTLLSFQRPSLARAGQQKASDSRQRPSGVNNEGRIRSLEGAPVVE